MTFIIRKLIARMVADATARSEDAILPLLTPALKGKKNSLDLKLGLSVTSLNSDEEDGSRSKRPDFNVLNEKAMQIAKKITCPDHVQNISVEKGVLYFSLDPLYVIKQVIQDVSEQQGHYGYHPYPGNDGKLNIIVEYSSPNIAKPFHAGHLRSTLIGNFFANLQERLGHNVTRINYLGDWGTQFGILGVGFQDFGNEEKLRMNPIQHLYEVYVATNKAAQNDPTIWERAKDLFRRMEQGDSDALAMRHRFQNLSIADYKRTYQRLGVHFDEYCSESQYSSEAQNLINTLRDGNLLTTSKRGTGDINLSDVCPRFPIATLAKSDGSSLYLTRDIAAVLDRRKRHTFDDMYYVVDKGQEGHFEQLKGVLRKMDQDCFQRIHHIKFGKVLGMQSRKGTAVFLTDILDEARDRMLHNMTQTSTTKEQEDPERVAEILGVSAIILQDLKGSVITDYKFEWDRVLTSQGDTGVFLQYSHARLCSIEEMNSIPESSSHDDIDWNLLCEPEAVQLAWFISHYDVAVRRAALEREPKAVAQYLLQLGHLISRANNKLKVKGSPADVQRARLGLFRSARITLANGMKLLGMTPLTQM
ncbi:probable arginine--tRNA ligase, mitochondrial [Lytechinus pictus]|uniref:probable arginine--tRNA ligase, mitochondrial n=1 Tax=Lytechinus pictus TaxID=7653 RepID=UPI0030BA0D08